MDFADFVKANSHVQERLRKVKELYGQGKESEGEELELEVDKDYKRTQEAEADYYSWGCMLDDD